MMTPYYEQDGITIYHGDCREILPTLQSVRLVVTDPPYVFGIASTAQEGKAGGWGDLMNSSIWYESWLSEVKRLTVNAQGCAWVFNSWRSFPVLARAAYGISWPVESLMVWDKEWIGPGGQRGLRPSYEVAALFAHPDFAIKDRGLPDIWRSQWSSLKPNGHPAEKPVPLLAKMIRESGGGLVLDPFMGSGSTLVAAKREGEPAIGIEVEERWCEIAAKRLAQGALPMEFSA
jgi:DNA modification methylase